MGDRAFISSRVRFFLPPSFGFQCLSSQNIRYLLKKRKCELQTQSASCVRVCRKTIQVCFTPEARLRHTYHGVVSASFQNFHQTNVTRRQSYNGRLVSGVVRNPWYKSREVFNVLIFVFSTCLCSLSRLCLLLFIPGRIQCPFSFCLLGPIDTI